MTAYSSRALRLSVVGIAAMALAACASHPKPLGPTANSSPPPPPPPSYSGQSSAAPGPGGVEESQANTPPTPGSERDFVINVGDRIYFDFDHFDLKSEAHGVLDGQAAWLARYPAVRVRIEGNCDEMGTREYNFALGERRANAVRDYLIARGVSGARIETVSYGKEHPIDTGGGDEARAHNRNAHTAITQGAR